MKTAFTVWNDRIAPLFDVAGKILLVESKAGNITAQTRVCLDDPLPALKARRLADLGVQMLVCGAISRTARNMITAYGIELAAYINGDLDTVIDAWRHDKLRTAVLRMPGCNSPFQRACISSRWKTKEVNMRNDQWGGCYQDRYGKGRKGQGAGGEGRARMGSGLGQGAGRESRARQGGGLGRSNKSLGHCICAACGHQVPHQNRIPCLQQRCPNCGETMIRK